MSNAVVQARSVDAARQDTQRPFSPPCEGSIADSDPLSAQHLLERTALRLRLPDWRTMRPAAEMYLPGEGCKWPDNDCREPRLPGRPYCHAHLGRAYVACEEEKPGPGPARRRARSPVLEV